MTPARPISAPARRHPLVAAPKPALIDTPFSNLDDVRLIVGTYNRREILKLAKEIAPTTVLSPRLSRTALADVVDRDAWKEPGRRSREQWFLCMERLADYFVIPKTAESIQVEVCNRLVPGALKITWLPPPGGMTMEKYLATPQEDLPGCLGDPWIDDDDEDVVVLAISLEYLKVKLFPKDFDLWVNVYYWS